MTTTSASPRQFRLAASTFEDDKTTNHAVNALLRLHWDAIRQWRDEAVTGRFVVRGDVGKKVGRVLTDPGTKPRKSSFARAVLKRTLNQHGFVVLAAYPDVVAEDAEAERQLLNRDLPVSWQTWSQRYPELTHLLGGFFNQDFPDDFQEFEDGIGAYVEVTDLDTRRRALDEVRRLGGQALSDDALFLVLRWLGLELEPRAVGFPTIGAWVRWLEVQLTISVTEFAPGTREG